MGSILHNRLCSNGNDSTTKKLRLVPLTRPNAFNMMHIANPTLALAYTLAVTPSPLWIGSTCGIGLFMKQED